MSVKSYDHYIDIPMRTWATAEDFEEPNYVFKLVLGDSAYDIQLFKDWSTDRWQVYPTTPDSPPFAVPRGMTEEEMLAWALVVGQM